MQDGTLHGIHLRLHAHHLVAVEGTEMIFLAVHFERGQVRGAEIVAQDALGGFVIPGTADDDGGVSVEFVNGGGTQEEGGIHQLLHALDGDQALRAVEGIVDGNEGTVVSRLPDGMAAGA